MRLSEVRHLRDEDIELPEKKRLYDPSSKVWQIAFGPASRNDASGAARAH